MAKLPADILQQIQTMQAKIANLERNASNASGVSRLLTWSRTSTVTASTVNVTTFVKDVDIGDVSFIVNSTLQWYRLTWESRFDTTVAGSTYDVALLDGGASSPVSGSTILDERSFNLGVAGGAGGTSFAFSTFQQFSIGVHTIAGFARRTVGTGVGSFTVTTGGIKYISVETV